MTNLPHITRFGLPGIDRVPFGMHACHFYRNRDQLLAAQVPFALAGLRGNERCLWLTAPMLAARDAIEALRTAAEDVDEAIQTGSFRILDSDRLSGIDAAQLWIEEEARALAEGYSGLRIAGNTSFLAPSQWPARLKYEEAMTAHFKHRRIVALCSYALGECDDRQMTALRHAHHCAMDAQDADWEVSVDPQAPHPGSEGMRDLNVAGDC